MRNTLILVGQIHQNQIDGLDPYHAVVEATVQRSRPMILTALGGAVLAFTLIGGTALTLVFLPALYAIWFRIKPVKDGQRANAPHPATWKPALD